MLLCFLIYSLTVWEDANYNRVISLTNQIAFTIYSLLIGQYLEWKIMQYVLDCFPDGPCAIILNSSQKIFLL